MTIDPRFLLSEKILNKGSGPVDEVIPAGKLSAQKALTVYADAYRARLIDALGETFEATWWCLGDELFKKMAEQYIFENPSVFYNLSDYGHKFPEFLKLNLAVHQLDFVSDLANFEWEFSLLFHESEVLSEINLDTLRTLGSDFSFELVPQMRLFKSEYGILNIWNSYKENSKKKPSWDTPQSFILFKFENNLKIRELTTEEFIFLRSAKAGRSLVECVESIFSLGREINPDEMHNLFNFLGEYKLINAMHNKL